MRQSVPHGKNVPITTARGITPEAVILFFHSIADKHSDDLFDSRILYEFLARSTEVTQQAHEAWIAFAKRSALNKDGLAFRKLDLRTNSQGTQFMMLNWLQSALLVLKTFLFSGSKISCASLEGKLFDFSVLHRSQTYNLEIRFNCLDLFETRNKSREEWITQYHTKSMKESKNQREK